MVPFMSFLMHVHILCYYFTSSIFADASHLRLMAPFETQRDIHELGVAIATCLKDTKYSMSRHKGRNKSTSKNGSKGRESQRILPWWCLSGQRR